jgi:hypothetical protein
MIEGSGAAAVPRTNGSGSRRTKNIGILSIRIRIRNTAFKLILLFVFFFRASWRARHRYPATRLSRTLSIHTTRYSWRQGAHSFMVLIIHPSLHLVLKRCSFLQRDIPEGRAAHSFILLIIHPSLSLSTYTAQLIINIIFVPLNKNKRKKYHVFLLLWRLPKLFN